MNLPQGFNGTEKYYTTDLGTLLHIFHVTGIKEVRENLNRVLIKNLSLTLYKIDN